MFLTEIPNVDDLVEAIYTLAETDNDLEEELKDYFWNKWWQGSPHKSEIDEQMPIEMIEHMIYSGHLENWFEGELK